MEKLSKLKNRNIKIFSFFAGSGFLDLAFERNGFDIVFVNEFKKSFMDAYIYSRQQMNLSVCKKEYCQNDINNYFSNNTGKNQNDFIIQEKILSERKDGNIIGFIGGPPCPDFSNAGKNRGKEGDNGKLSLSYVKLIIQNKPDFFLFENVKGLWKTKKHRQYYEELKLMLHQNGYIMKDRLTNSLEFGVAQDRDRILLFGVRKELCNSLEDFKFDRFAKHKIENIKRYNWPEVECFAENSVKPCPKNIPQELTVEYFFRKNNVENHPNAQCFFTPRKGKEKMLKIDEGDVSKKSYKRLHRWRYSPTAAYGNNEVHLHPYKARRLSVAEVLAIQSMPKDFSFPPDMSLTDMFKTAGNGVPYLMAEGVAKEIYRFLHGLVQQ